MSEAASSPPISLSDPATRQAAARRRLQVLQAFVKRKPTIATTATTNNDRNGRDFEENKKEMRWSPFVAFSRKVVALQEMNASSSSENEGEDGDVGHEGKHEKNGKQGLRQQSSVNQQAATKKKNKEIFEEAVYSLMEGGGKEEGTDESLSSQIVSIAARRRLINGAGPSSSHPPASIPLLSILERREAAGTSIGDVQASTRDGIDNTGNFHWPTEDITAAYFINKLVDSEETEEEAPRTVLCELGAGCGLASFAIAKALSVTKKSRPLQRHLIVATDGNSRVVHTLKRNAKRVTCTINEAASSSSTNSKIGGDQEHTNNTSSVLMKYSRGEDHTKSISVSAAKLPWQCETSLQHVFSTIDTWLDSATTSPPSTKRNNTVVLFGSDCLFFERFHHNLAYLVIKWMHHYAQMDGTEVRVLLFAPSRDGSLERFTGILNEEIIDYKKKRAGQDGEESLSSTTAPGISINVTIQSDYDECVTRVWKGVAIKDTRFNPDRHLPKLVSITSTTTTAAAV